MEDFINDEIDMVLEGINDDRDCDGLEPIDLNDEQRKQIFVALRDGYEEIWEDLYNAISDEIENFIEE